MVRNIAVELADAAPQAVVALGNDYADGHVIAPHRHLRGQLIFGASGMLVMTTPDGTWVMPPQRGMWIPPGVLHDVRMVGTVSLQSILLEPETIGGMPDRCQVVGISPFLRSLIAKALDLPADYDQGGHAGALMALIQHEMRRLPVLPLSLPFPAHEALARQCREFLLNPTAHDTIDAWCAALGLSRRSFTRLFRRETGLTFMTWRQQACLVVALPRLAAGESVTEVAMALGYDNPAAFTTMFKRVLGSAPRAYMKREERGGSGRSAGAGG
jgi:AraC-like DNA-binding protein